MGDRCFSEHTLDGRYCGRRVQRKEITPGGYHSTDGGDPGGWKAFLRDRIYSKKQIHSISNDDAQEGRKELTGRERVSREDGK